jgi:hypothetical protein
VLDGYVFPTRSLADRHNASGAADHGFAAITTQRDGILSAVKHPAEAGVVRRSERSSTGLGPRSGPMSGAAFRGDRADRRRRG